MVTRRKDDTLRLTGLFRRVPLGAFDASASQNTYPMESEACADDRPSTFLKRLQGSKGGHCSLRFRYPNRQSRNFLPSSGLGTINTQGLTWSRVSHRPKLQSVLTLARAQHVDILCLTEMHSSTVSLEVVYLEEFVVVCRGGVGLLLRLPFAMLWEQGERKVFYEDASGRMLGIAFCYQGRDVVVGANYSPASAEVGHRRSHMGEFLSLFRRIQAQNFEQLWGGDWNAHLKGDGIASSNFGPRGLQTDTTMGGRVLREALTSTPLIHLDSFAAIKFRGTWQHNQTKKWYELDFFVGTQLFQSAMQTKG